VLECAEHVPGWIELAGEKGAQLRIFGYPPAPSAPVPSILTLLVKSAVPSRSSGVPLSWDFVAAERNATTLVPVGFPLTLSPMHTTYLRRLLESFAKACGIM
jgi:hypothetical protein